MVNLQFPHWPRKQNLKTKKKRKEKKRKEKKAKPVPTVMKHLSLMLREF